MLSMVELLERLRAIREGMRQDMQDPNYKRQLKEGLGGDIVKEIFRAGYRSYYRDKLERER